MGMSVAATGARLAEIKSNVGATNTAFGVSIMVGNLGSLLGTFIGGRIAHRIGTRRLVQIIIFGVAISQGLYGFLNALWQVPLVAFFAGTCYALGNVGVNSQASMIESRFGKSLLPSFHGSWSLGALFGSLSAGAIARVLTPEKHLVINSVIALIGVTLVSRRLLPILADRQDIAANQGIEHKQPIPKPIKKYLYIVSMGSLLALMAEASVGDWSSILLKEDLHLAIGINTLGYSSFLLAQIIGRFSAGKLIDKFGIPKVLRVGGIAGGLGYAAGLLISISVVHQSKYLALVIMCIAYVILGLGVAPMPPAYVTVSGSIPGLPTSRALARMGIFSSMGFFLGRGIVSLLAGVVPLPFALLFPALALIGSGLLASRLDVKDSERRSAL